MGELPLQNSLINTLCELIQEECGRLGVVQEVILNLRDRRIHSGVDPNPQLLWHALIVVNPSFPSRSFGILVQDLLSG